MSKGQPAKWHVALGCGEVAQHSHKQEVRRPALSAGEYAVLVSIEVPYSAFKPRPLPEATIRVPESSLVAAPIEVEVEDPPPAIDAGLDEALERGAGMYGQGVRP